MVKRSFNLVLAALVLTLASASTATAAPVWVTITSSPPGAAVYVDGKERGAQGITSDTFKLRLNPGAHKVILELDGYRPVDQVVQIGKKAQRLVFTLERAPARLAVRSPAASDDARGGEIFVDGVPKGTVPAEVELTQGSHLLEVRKPGFKIFSETVELRPAESRTLLVTLRAEIRRGTLLISATGEGLVYVHGQVRGGSPQVVELDEGEHDVEVRKGDGGEKLWGQRVKVVAGQQTRVLAEFKIPEKMGSLLVIAPDDAEVVVDGTQTFKANQEIPNLKVGQHVVQVQGKGYLAVTRVIEVEANRQKVERVTLEKSAAARGVATLRVVMVNPVPGAEYYVNGRRVQEEAILSDRGIEVPAGANVVVAQRPGFGRATRQVNIAPGAAEAVQLELKNTGRLTVTSTPPGAEVRIDGRPIGAAPLTAEDVPGGPHTLEVVLAGFQPFVGQVQVQGGEPVAVQADLQRVQVAPPRALRPDMHASWSAVSNDPGRFTVDVGGGFPYFVNVALSVGAVRRGMFGLDAGVEGRSDFFYTEVGVRLRSQLFLAGPIAGGLNLLIGGGGGPDQRNDFVLELGAPLTLIAGRYVQLTARPYLQVYSDRVCPSAELARANPGIVNSSTVGTACTGGNEPPNPNALQAAIDGTYSPNNSLYHVAGQGVLERYTSARFLIQAALEVYLTRNVNLFVLFEVAPGLQRQSLTRKFNALAIQENDLGVYGRGGVTFKF